MTDASWSPQTSTVFALTTVDGKVHVYDLSINKYNPLCVQAIVNRLGETGNVLLRLFIDRKKSRLNHISFNKDHPMLLVGDSAGLTHSLKLSPNLRWPRKL